MMTNEQSGQQVAISDLLMRQLWDECIPHPIAEQGVSMYHVRCFAESVLHFAASRLSASIADTAGAKPVGRVYKNGDLWSSEIYREVVEGLPAGDYWLYSSHIAAPPAPSVADSAGTSDVLNRLLALAEENGPLWAYEIRDFIAKEQA